MSGASLSSDDPVAVSGYTLRRRLGAGGMGVVYLAEHPERLGPLALKLLRPEFAGDAAFRARFAREVSALRAVQGLHTVRIIDAGTYEERPYLVTDYIDGPALSEAIASGPLPAGQVRRLARSLAVALADIHAARVVHRDLKPANVLMAADGIKVIDFGIAQLADATALTTTGSAIGTIGYMAPEQIRGTPGPATDVFAWALTVSHAASGRPPFGTGPVEAVIYRVLNEQADVSGLPAGLEGPVAAALAKQPEARPTAAQLVAMCDGTMPAAVPQAPAPVPAIPAQPHPVPAAWSAAPAPPAQAAWGTTQSPYEPAPSPYEPAPSPYGTAQSPYGTMPQGTGAGRKGRMAGWIVAGLVIAGVAVFVLGRLIGIGPGGGKDRAGAAPTTPSPSHSATKRKSPSASPSASRKRTPLGAPPKAIHYQPFSASDGPGGPPPAPGFKVTAYASGTCPGTAETDRDRPDAYYCDATVQEQDGTSLHPAKKYLLDPCFISKTRDGILCPDTTEPEGDYNVHDVVDLQPTSPIGDAAPSPIGPGFFAIRVARKPFLAGSGIDCFLDLAKSTGSAFHMNCKDGITATLPRDAGGAVRKNANGSITATVHTPGPAGQRPFKARVTATYG